LRVSCESPFCWARRVPAVVRMVGRARVAVPEWMKWRRLTGGVDEVMV